MGVIITNAPYTGDGHTSSGSSWETAGTDTSQWAFAQYNFGLDGGAIGAITPAVNATIPKGAILLGGVALVSTSLAGAAATISIGTTAGSTATSFMGATPVASFTSGTMFTPSFTTSPVQMSAKGKINITVATTALTAGVINIWFQYVLSPQ